MKKKKIVVAISLLTALLVILALYSLMNVRVKNESITMVEFTSIPIKDKEIERINNKELNWIGDNELWQLQEKSDSDYGNLFIVYYRINYKRYNLLNDYQVTEKLDFSDLSEEERVFFLKVNGFSNEFLYQEQDGEDKSVACKNVILKGITYGKSKEELERIIRKVKINLCFRDEFGRSFEKEVVLTDNNIIWDRERSYGVEGEKEKLEEFALKDHFGRAEILDGH
ncbi:MAG: hypothetical protein J5988_01875 [Eubacterium sp.]|nr:hypothetical protein [Eubacterium sp.]